MSPVVAMRGRTCLRKQRSMCQGCQVFICSVLRNDWKYRSRSHCSVKMIRDVVFEHYMYSLRDAFAIVPSKVQHLHALGRNLLIIALGSDFLLFATLNMNSFNTRLFKHFPSY